MKDFPGELDPHFIGPFQVTKAVGANAFELELPGIMNVHPVFSVFLLCKYHGKCKPSGPIIIVTEAEYDAEKILRYRGNGKFCQYLVRHLGYNEKEHY